MNRTRFSGHEVVPDDAPVSREAPLPLRQRPAGRGWRPSRDLLESLPARLRGAPEAKLLDGPLLVVDLHEGAHGLVHPSDIPEDAAVDDRLLEGSVEAFRDAVGLGLLDEGEGRRDGPEADLVLEVVGALNPQDDVSPLAYPGTLLSGRDR